MFYWLERETRLLASFSGSTKNESFSQLSPSLRMIISVFVYLKSVQILCSFFFF